MNPKIKMEDIPETQRDIAEVIGIEAFINLSKLCGGQSGIYIQKYSELVKGARNREIRTKYQGYNAGQLAKDYNLSERQIRHIIKKRRRLML